MVNMAEEARATEFDRIGRGISQADTMQALTGDGPVFQYSTSVDNAADLASAAGAQQLQGRTQGLTAQRGDQINVLKNARGMQADAQSGLSQAARIESSKQLDFARAKQARRNANFKAANKMVGQMGQNFQENLGYQDAGGDSAKQANLGFFSKFLPAQGIGQT